jgi:AcrR family transcriptional regulator
MDITATDGRRKRSETSRQRIVEAMIALVGEGHMSPSAEQVATRAGVGLRTVFRHFADMDSLYASMALRLEREYEDWLDPFEGRTGVPSWRK